MATRNKSERPRTEAAVLARAWRSIADHLTPTLARHVLRLRFSEEDKTRMHQLAERNSAGKLNGAERAELEGYVGAGDLIAIIQSAARRRLKSQRNGAVNHG
jgi:hypothetical protein